MIKATTAGLALALLMHAPAMAQSAAGAAQHPAASSAHAPASSSAQHPAASSKQLPASSSTHAPASPPHKSVYAITSLPLPGARLAPAHVATKPDTVPTMIPTKEIVPGPAKKK
jgi:hypothetical protein